MLKFGKNLAIDASGIDTYFLKVYMCKTTKNSNQNNLPVRRIVILYYP